MFDILTTRRGATGARRAFQFVAAFLACVACQPVPPNEPAADLVFTNARIYTVDAANPWAETIAIRDGKILGVGNSDDVQRWVGAQTRVVDLRGKLVLPAFGDAHAHPVMGGLSYAGCSLHHAASVDEYLEVIAACVAADPGTGLVYGRGWRPGLFPPDGVPTRDLLDPIAPDRPLVFQSIGGHSLWVNSQALALAGITRDTPDPPNGRIDRDPATGDPVGGLQEAARDLVMAHVPPPTTATLEEAILYAAAHFNSLGITQWLDAGIEVAPDGSSDVLEAYRSLHEQNKLTVHTALTLKWDNTRGGEQLAMLVDTAGLARRRGLRVDGIKFYLDGVIAQRTAAMLEPYTDSPQERGELQISREVFDAAVAAFDARNFQVYVHAIGDRAVRTSLDAFAAARAANGAMDNRHVISHLNVIQPDDQPRFADLNVFANLQPLWARMDPYMQMTAVRLGPKRMRHVYPAASLLDAGASIAYGADWSVASANPLEGIETALTRRDPHARDAETLLPGEGVTLQQAIEAYTLNVARVNRLEEVTGSIAAGKFADLVVLSRDLFALPERDISEVKVLLTVFRGNVVHGELPHAENTREGGH